MVNETPFFMISLYRNHEKNPSFFNGIIQLVYSKILIFFIGETWT